MDLLSSNGKEPTHGDIIIVTLMMIFYVLETRFLWWTLVFSVSYLGTSIYGFLAGTWPFSVVEFIWCLLTLRKWYLLYARKENITGKTE